MKTQGIDERRRKSSEEAPLRTWLVRVGSANAPFRAPGLIPIDTARRLEIGRSDERELGVLETGQGLRLDVRDPWMSSAHAELVATPEGWQVRDLGSSNGTLFWGQRRSSFFLGDGDLFDTGGTFWLFRSTPVRGPLSQSAQDGPLGSLHPGFVEVVERARKLARTRVPVLILGATGTGKEVLAREIHELSQRTGPFLAVNTAAIQRQLVASELFGVEKGAHSTAEAARVGQIRSAEGGTILLDEIGDMPPEVQVSMLRVLQESEVIPVGGALPLKVDVRFICATHRDLPALVKEQQFRADLYARVKGALLELPPLEDRLEDIGLLVARFLWRYGGERFSFSTAAYRALLAYNWPLNVRELEKAIESAVALASDDRIELEHLPAEISEYKGGEWRTSEAAEDRGDVTVRERELVRMLSLHKGNLSRVARSMGYSRTQILRWIRRYNLDLETFKLSTV